MDRIILVTGGAGYIGSHVCCYLKQQGWNPVCFDNFSTGHEWAVKYGPLVKGDLLNPHDIYEAIQEHKPLAVMHLASFIQVGESVKDPLKYYQNNVTGMINLLNAMREGHVPYMIFSSSAAVYGNPEYTPIDEKNPCHPINPYGHSKLMIEQILKDCAQAYGIRSISLRYFNAAGAAPEEGLGEAHEPESHLIPLMIQAAQKGTFLKVFGNDYETRDGTCLRDYIHILDLADAHLKALEYLQKGGETASLNLGSGHGTTNLEMIQLLEKLFGARVPFEYGNRREGDPAELVSSYDKAKEILGWNPTRPIEQILNDAWKWSEK
ncbi:UDP-glucose 4-epimerase GalE [Candidatus Finniella inopinata]|uniref:UDP-glucose 4-epimerase n=1 Tax=Candidatus Finniella inopinata TaxID=1696036 RepID=A0A4Q7DLC1_9PROT|nr:UDP-glucose 4-epimerase GalE [Candidatus Finniella inopinata]RZI47149.1 UDP-glucose 4-epimerase GalE [Candidatus Finniella inopinata]